MKKNHTLLYWRGKEDFSLKRVPTCKLEEFISSIVGKKNVAIESVGFVHPIYEKISSIDDCKVYVANPNEQA